MRGPRRIGARPNTALVVVLLLGLSSAARPAAAQLPGSGARALGMGGNYTALARGHEALQWSPAGLALPGSGRWSVGLLAVSGGAGFGPVGLGDVGAFADRRLTAATREAWLGRIAQQGWQDGSFRADVTYLSLAYGRVALEVGTTLAGGLRLTPDAAELLLFGNAGRTGVPRDLVLAGSEVSVAATSTVAIAYARPLSLRIGQFPDQHLAVGIAARYTIGHLLLRGWEAGSTVASDPLTLALAFPIVQTDTTGLNQGVGVGLDVAASWEGGPYAASLGVRDLVQTFAWDEAKLLYRPGKLVIGGDSARAQIALRPLEGSPPEFRRSAVARLSDADPPPTLVAGVAARLRPDLIVTADLRQRLGGSVARLGTGAGTHVGLGAELRIRPALAVRTGAAVLSDGFRIAGGLGAWLGPLRLDLGATYRSGPSGGRTAGAIAASLRDR